jgi:hypothetical protein
MVGEWSAGTVTKSVTLTGGGGKDSIYYTLTDGYGDDGVSPAIGVGTATSTKLADFWEARWVGTDSSGSGATTFMSAVENARVAMTGATRVVNTAARGTAERAIQGGAEDWNYGGADDAAASQAIHAVRYYLTAGEVSGVIASRMQVRLAGAYATGYFTSNPSFQGIVNLGFSYTEPITFSDLTTMFNLIGNFTCYGGKCIWSWGGTYQPPYGGNVQYGPPYTDSYITIPTSIIQGASGQVIYFWMLHDTDTITPGSWSRSYGGYDELIYTGGAGALIQSFTIES